ncbi:MAG: endonuclease Q family protein [Dissulfurispiraceae bacterium]
MSFIADLHIHSKHSRATSKNFTPEEIWNWAQLKGVNVVGTGDFTHPKWFRELKEKTEPMGNGLFRLKDTLKSGDIPDSCKANPFFLLSAEISCIYKKKGRTRKIHSIVLVPDFAVAAKINGKLSTIGNLSSDGRPILKLDAKELLNIVLTSSPDAMLVPAHAWTPHFSLFGAVSGFDSLEVCFEDLEPHIYAIETGLSSDPKMNWRLSSLDRITLISNSDAHSPSKIGREANIFDTGLSYTAIVEAIKTKKGFAGTIEFYPEEGKYHYDGHRLCGASLSPEETIKNHYLCPVCGKRVTVGVLLRVETLADRENGFTPVGAPPFYSVIPLPEIIAEALKVGVSSKVTNKEYFRLLKALGNEFRILIDTPISDFEMVGSPLLGEAISKMRSGNVHIEPGFDGDYGKIRIFEGVQRKKIQG